MSAMSNVYVVRLWVPCSGEQPDGEVCGVVEHVATGGSRTFKDAGELVRFLRASAETEPKGEQR